MKRIPVNSSAIVSIGYDAAKELLEVEFVDHGGIYQYYDVVKAEYEELMRASSIGAYFNQYIKFQHEEYKVD